MTKRFQKSLVTVFALLSLVIIGRSQINQQDALDLVAENPCVRNLETNPTFLRIVRMEGLEDDMFEFQPKSPSNIFKKVLFFTVTNTGYFIVNNQILAVKSTGSNEVLVAVSAGSRKTFGLNGCVNANENFERLLGNIGIRITSIDEARQFAVLRYVVVSDPRQRRLIENFRQLRHEVEDYYFSNFGQNEAQRLFANWLRLNGKLEKGLKLGFTTIRQSNFYITTVTYIRGTENRRVELERLSFKFNESGIITELRTSTLIR